MYPANITNEEINQLPAAEFEGRFLIVDDSKSMQEAEQTLRRAKYIGFDTETRPAFKKGEHHDVALLQLATKEVAVLFRLNKIELSPKILKILESQKTLKIGAAIRDDLRGLRHSGEFKPDGFVDLQRIVGEWGIEGISVRKMAAIVLGVKVSKAQRLSNWEAQQLTQSQIDYAAVDAWVCHEIYMKLKNIKNIK